MDNSSQDRFYRDRQLMIANDLIGRGISDAKVLAVMGKVRREEFVPERYREQTYADGPLPIGCGQTISQPYIVALMTEELHVKADCEVLEIGTGSGYQTAVLAGLAKRVYTIEHIGQLSEAAQTVLGRCGIENVEFYIGDGSLGWPGGKVFDRIIITAAVPEVPGPLVEQLKNGGIIVAPVGSGGVQELIVGHKKKGQLISSRICEVRFVRLIGEHGFAQ